LKAASGEDALEEKRRVEQNGVGIGEQRLASDAQR
jgi:hypothetical protein